MKPYKIFVENEVDEYYSHEFENYYKTYGIKRQLPAAYSLSQNGVWEIRNHISRHDMIFFLTMSDVLKKYFYKLVN